MNRTTFVKSLQGLADARGIQGIAARGKNVYGGTRMAPRSSFNIGPINKRKYEARKNLAQGMSLPGKARQEWQTRVALKPPAQQPVSGVPSMGAVARRLYKSR